MTMKRPLCNYSGELFELKDSHVVPAAGINRTVQFNISGEMWGDSKLIWEDDLLTVTGTVYPSILKLESNDCTGEDLALGKDAYAIYESRSAGNAVDGSEATSWYSGTYSGYQTTPSWWYFDAGSSITVHSLKMYKWAYFTPLSIDVQCSDDAVTWTTVKTINPTEEGTGVWEEFTDIQASYTVPTNFPMVDVTSLTENTDRLASSYAICRYVSGEIAANASISTHEAAADPHSTAYLAKTNTTIYTPTANYHPATKKYVDDNAGGGGSDLSIDGGFANSTYTAAQSIDGGSASG